MRSWLAARSDGAHYGKLMALNFPKAKLIYGPKQIEARIDQETEISQKLTLWGQGGSQVIRGSLLAIPIENSLLYVQPLYLAADKGSLPELKRVITAFGNKIVMEDNLEQSLKKLFGDPVIAKEDEAKDLLKAHTLFDGIDLPRKAMVHYSQAMALLRDGKWTGFGKEIKKLEIRFMGVHLSTF